MGKRMNPDTVTLDDIRRMGTKEFRVWSYLRLNGIESRLKRHDKRFTRFENMLWGLLAAIIAAILAAVFG